MAKNMIDQIREVKDANFLGNVIKKKPTELAEFLVANKKKLGYEQVDTIDINGIKQQLEGIWSNAVLTARQLHLDFLDEKIRILEQSIRDNLNNINNTNEKELLEGKQKSEKHYEELQSLNNNFNDFANSDVFAERQISIELPASLKNKLDEVKIFHQSYIERVNKAIESQFKKQIEQIPFFTLYKDEQLGFEISKIKESELAATVENQKVFQAPDTVLESSNSREVKYKGRRLSEDEIIVARRQYTDKKGQPLGVGIITQTSAGKITNSSKGKLTHKQKNDIAIQQVLMLVSNYDASKGNIILRGHDAEMAKKVYAGLLLASKHINLKPENIDVRIEGVKPGRLTSHRRYIDKHLGRGYVLNTLSKETHKSLDESLQKAQIAQKNLKSRLEGLKPHETGNLKQKVDASVKEIEKDPENFPQFKKP